MSNPNEIQDIEDGEIIEEQIVDEEPETMALYEVDVMNLVKQMDLQQRYLQKWTCETHDCIQILVLL